MPSLIAPLFRSSFWFSLQTQPFSTWVSYLLLFLLLALFISALAVFVYRKQQVKEKMMKRVWQRMFACLLSAALIGSLLYFLTWQRIPLLGMRIFWPIWFFAHLAWGYSIWNKARTQIPVMLQAQRERAAYEKWLPKAKK